MLGELHARTVRPLLQLCLRITCAVADADDAVRETFVDVRRGLSAFRGEALGSRLHEARDRLRVLLAQGRADEASDSR